MGADEEKSSAIESMADNHTTADVLIDERSLPAQDGGRQAWLFLAGAAVIEIVAWGNILRMLFH